MPSRIGRTRRPPKSVLRTADVIAADGWEVDLPLWADAAKCGPCHPGSDSH
ncbi:hypothetical protein [Streptomyces sp. NPDC050535]|uniref:hypothetical protein n=1 Tax=Streptomyces sp. NPDC050535 TaxID=3365626 RepID=UPI0037B9EDD0